MSNNDTTAQPATSPLTPEELRGVKITYGKAGSIKYSRTDEDDSRHLFGNSRIGYYFTDDQVRRMLAGDLVMENLTDKGPRAYRINTRPAQPPVLVPADMPDRQGLITPAFVCSCHNCNSVLVLLNEPRPFEAMQKHGWRPGVRWRDVSGLAWVYCPACQLPE